jgi:hypothetical protein
MAIVAAYCGHLRSPASGAGAEGQRVESTRARTSLVLRCTSSGFREAGRSQHDWSALLGTEAARGHLLPGRLLARRSPPPLAPPPALWPLQPARVILACFVRYVGLSGPDMDKERQRKERRYELACFSRGRRGRVSDSPLGGSRGAHSEKGGALRRRCRSLHATTRSFRTNSAPVHERCAYYPRQGER